MRHLFFTIAVLMSATFVGQTINVVNDTTICAGSTVNLFVDTTGNYLHSGPTLAGFHTPLHYNGSYYYLSQTPSTYGYADSVAKSLGGQLASISDMAENQAVVNYAIPYGVTGTWIGLADDLGTMAWAWEDTTPVNFLNWNVHNNEPNGYPVGGANYTHMWVSNFAGTWAHPNSQPGSWNDNTGLPVPGLDINFVVEIPAKSQVNSILWSTGDTTSAILVSPTTTTTYDVYLISGSDTLTDNVTVYTFNCDTCIKFDTTYVTVVDTQVHYDTVTIRQEQLVYDTVVINVYDTTYVTVYDTLYIENNVGTGSDELAKKPIKLYPNPTNGTLVLEGEVYNYTLNIYSSNGQLVYNQYITEDRLSLNMSTLGARGTYLFQLLDENYQVYDNSYVIFD